MRCFEINSKISANLKIRQSTSSASSGSLFANFPQHLPLKGKAKNNGFSLKRSLKRDDSLNKTSNTELTKNSQNLRKNMTKEEKHLWYDFLKKLPVTVHRQKVIAEYIVDFYCAEAKLVIELDGSQHYEEEVIKTDIERDKYLKSLGLTVLRYSNIDINRNFDSVCADIENHIKKSSL